MDLIYRARASNYKAEPAQRAGDDCRMPVFAPITALKFIRCRAIRNEVSEDNGFRQPTGPHGL